MSDFEVWKLLAPKNNGNFSHLLSHDWNILFILFTMISCVFCSCSRPLEFRECWFQIEKKYNYSMIQHASPHCSQEMAMKTSYRSRSAPLQWPAPERFDDRERQIIMMASAYSTKNRLFNCACTWGGTSFFRPKEGASEGYLSNLHATSSARTRHHTTARLSSSKAINGLVSSIRLLFVEVISTAAFDVGMLSLVRRFLGSLRWSKRLA